MLKSVDRLLGVSATLVLGMTFLLIRQTFRRERRRRKLVNRAHEGDDALREADVFFRERHGPRARLVKHKGACHCRRVSFELSAPARIRCVDCSCSICSKKGRYPHLVVPVDHFKLLAGMDDLNMYQYGMGDGRHFFCRNCGVHVFHHAGDPRGGAEDMIDVNVHTIDTRTLTSISVAFFQGSHCGDDKYAPRAVVQLRGDDAVAAEAAAGRRSPLMEDVEVTSVCSSGGGGGGGGGAGAGAGVERPHVLVSTGATSSAQPEAYASTLMAWAKLDSPRSPSAALDRAMSDPPMPRSNNARPESRDARREELSPMKNRLEHHLKRYVPSL